MAYREYTAKTIAEAITQACVELGITSDRLDYSVVQEPTNGFLGIGSKPAIIKAGVRSEQKKADPETVKKEVKAAPKKAAEEKATDNVKETVKEASEAKKVITSDEIEKRAAAAAARAKNEPEVKEEKPERREQSDRRPNRRRNGRNDRRDSRNGRGDRRNRPLPPEVREVEEKPHKPSVPKPERVVTPKTEEEVAAIKKIAEDFLKSVFESMKMDVKITMDYNIKEDSLNCTFDGEEMGILIGKRGQTLDSLQYLTSLVINKTQNEYVRVKLDTEDYRVRRTETLQNLARNIAFKVKRTGRAVALEPMNPYERRIIHSSLQSNRYVETYSEGEEPYRHVIVAPKH